MSAQPITVKAPNSLGAQTVRAAPSARPPTPEVRPLVVGDLAQVAAVHKLAFPSGALTQLGIETLRRFYEAQLLGPHEIHAFGFFNGKQCAAYCLAGVFNDTMAGFLQRNFLFLVWQMLLHPTHWTNPLVRERLGGGLKVIKRNLRKWLFPTSAMFAAKEKTALASAEKNSVRFTVSVIAVNPTQQQHGLGKRLMHQAEQRARQSGFHEANLTVHPTNTQAIRFYEGLGWAKVAPDGIWKGRMEKHLEPLL